MAIQEIPDRLPIPPFPVVRSSLHKARFKIKFKNILSLSPLLHQFSSPLSPVPTTNKNAMATPSSKTPSTKTESILVRLDSTPTTASSGRLRIRREPLHTGDCRLRQEIAPRSTPWVPVQRPRSQDGHSTASHLPNGPRPHRIRARCRFQGFNSQ
ncbi:uncharacterized protein LOC131323071 [Rhododendron vialii]|uniref:uncharacterized protein LOC131323071 n=1 Tax=Rhododendron vialii TaxID=182163 RepID=UPI00265D78AF|nr:uncharacterized protein LOC131323071 [Rhododendron vialii]